jgi:hypothetical protein
MAGAGDDVKPVGGGPECAYLMGASPWQRQARTCRRAAGAHLPPPGGVTFPGFVSATLTISQEMIMTGPLDILATWMQAVNDGDLDTVLGMYDEEAVLIPTFSNRLLNTPAKLREYFERLGARDDLSIALHQKTVIVHEVQAPVYTLSGIYNWRFAVEGEILNFEARFSYVLDVSKPRPILHHHSSQIPRTL